MITNKETLKFYLAADKFALRKTKRCPKFLRDEIWRYEILLRKCEYYVNVKPNSPLALYYRFRFRLLSIRLGFSIPFNVIGPGLKINHIGPIVLNGRCRVGKWCDIHQGVNIGENGYLSDTGQWVHCVPVVGDYVYIGPGAKIFGDISIGDEVRIGANAVVNKSVESGMMVYGNPMNIKRSRNVVMSIAEREFEQDFLKKNPQYKSYLV